MIDSMFQEGTDAALNDQVTRPAPTPPPQSNTFGADVFSAPFRGIGAAAAKTIAFGAEMMGAFGQVAGAYDLGPNATPEQQRQADAAREKLLKPGGGIDYSNETGDLFRQRAADILPDPKTASTSAQIVAGLGDYATRAVGYSLTLGPLAPFAFGGDVGMEESDRLKHMGVDLATRTKAGAAAGALNAAAVALPMTGATALVRGAKGIAAGEGTIVGQSLAEQAILRAAGYDKQASSFDPLDPVALALGVVPGVLGAAAGHAPVKPAAERPRALQEMGLGERQALRYDDVRLDAYAVQAAQREGIPPEILLAVKNAGEKSGSNATSPKGAQGVMQFMPSTFRDFGRGDPTDPINSIDAGAKYLKSLFDTYGDWDAAIAHYNGGGRQAAKVRSGQAPVPETAAYLARVHDYLGKTSDEHVAQAVRAEPDLEPAARVGQVAQALDATRLTPDADIAGQDAHLSAVELAADQLGRGDEVNVPPIHDDSPVLYHGTGDAFEQFGREDQVQAMRNIMRGEMDGRFFFTDSAELASEYAMAAKQGSDGANVRPARLSLRDPLEIDAQGARGQDKFAMVEEAIAQAVDAKKDGVILRNVFDHVIDNPSTQTKPHTVYIAFRRDQIRSIFEQRLADTAAAADELRAARPAAQNVLDEQRARAPRNEPAPAEGRGRGVSGADRSPGPATGGRDLPNGPDRNGLGAGSDSGTPASVARASAEASLADPDMLVHLEGMDAPMRAGDLMARVQEEAKRDTLMGKLVEVAAACDLRA